MTLSSRILIGLLAGIATGLFFGELVADLKILGDVFLRCTNPVFVNYVRTNLDFHSSSVDTPEKLFIQHVPVQHVQVRIYTISPDKMAIPTNQHDSSII